MTREEAEKVIKHICSLAIDFGFMPTEEIIKARDIVVDGVKYEPMTREQAIENIEYLKRHLTEHGVFATETLDTAINALRGWVKTAERLPTEADTGDDGKILCVTVGVFGDTVILHVFWGIVAEHPERYPYWMPLPPLPEVEG